MKFFFLILCYGLICLNLEAEFFAAKYSTITPEMQNQMVYSWKTNNPVPLHDLRHLTILHWGFDSEVHTGELIVHKSLALEVIEIFEELFDAKFPIEKMVLIDAYQADDEASMEDNNSSAFCSRTITGTTDRFSKHSYGIAIDINPKMNPYVKNSIVLPKSGKIYLDRSQNIPGLINEESICYQVFNKRCWKWGGHWESLKDYQHFEKDLPL